MGKLRKWAYTILDMEGVSGSIPLPPTIHIKTLARWAFRFAHEMPIKRFEADMGQLAF